MGAGARAHPWGGFSLFKMHYSISFQHQSITGRPPLGEILYPPLPVSITRTRESYTKPPSSQPPGMASRNVSPRSHPGGDTCTTRGHSRKASSTNRRGRVGLLWGRCRAGDDRGQWLATPGGHRDNTGRLTAMINVRSTPSRQILSAHVEPESKNAAAPASRRVQSLNRVMRVSVVTSLCHRQCHVECLSSRRSAAGFWKLF